MIYFSLNQETYDWELENPDLYEDGKTKEVKPDSFTVQDFRRTTKKYLGKE